MMIASHLVEPSTMSTTWEDIAGLEEVIRELKETVILPIQKRELFDSPLTKAPKGVLLHGPPGKNLCLFPPHFQHPPPFIWSLIHSTLLSILVNTAVPPLSQDLIP